VGGVAVLKQRRAGKSTAISARYLQRAAQHTCVGLQLGMQLTLLRSIYSEYRSYLRPLRVRAVAPRAPWGNGIF
jgi:hypothetical protein